MNKIIISNYGSGLAIGLEGDAAFQEQQFNRFFNFGGTSKNAELHKESDRFSYFLSSEEEMIKALAAQTFVRFLQDGTSKLFKGMPTEMETATRLDAQNEFDSFERENFMARRSDGPSFVGGVAQNGRAEVWEEDFKVSK